MKERLMQDICIRTGNTKGRLKDARLVAPAAMVRIEDIIFEFCPYVRSVSIG